MKYTLLIAMAFASLAFVPQKKKHVIFFGDSITEAGVKPGGYITLVDSLCKNEKQDSRYQFTGAGIGGNKVYDLYLRMEEDVLKKNPDVVVIYVGVNDVWHKSSFGTGTDPDKFVKFYQAIINKLKEKNIQAILVTPAVIGEKADFSNPQDGDMNQYSQLIRDLAQKNSLPVVDLRQLFLEYIRKNNPSNQERNILTTDRVHLNQKGNLLVAEAMWKAIKGIN